MNPEGVGKQIPRSGELSSAGWTLHSCEPDGHWSARHSSPRRRVSLSEAALLSSPSTCAPPPSSPSSTSQLQRASSVSARGGHGPMQQGGWRWALGAELSRLMRLWCPPDVQTRAEQQRQHRHTRRRGISLIAVRACCMAETWLEPQKLCFTDSIHIWRLERRPPSFSRLRSTSWLLGPRTADSPVRVHVETKRRMRGG